MSLHRIHRVLTAFVAVLTTLTFAPLAWSQQTEGSVNVTVTDPQGAVIPKADVTLIDLSTNTARHASTTDNGTYKFIGLNVGNYKLTVNKSGFASKTLDQIVVAATKTTDLDVRLEVGVGEQTVQVTETAAPVLETTTNNIGTIIDPKQIETLPLNGRSVTNLAQLSPGYNGTWDGLPTSAQGNNIDGVVGSPSRMKFGGNSSPTVAPRLENIEEMAIQTDQLDMNQGFGQAAMQLNFVTRRGTNNWHGRAYEDHRNSWLNANSWSNNVNGLPRNRLIRNEFGGSVGGPILKEKLFFFASLSALRQPGSSTTANTLLTSGAQAGNFTYQGSDGQAHTVNLLTMANTFNPSLPGTVNGTVAAQLTTINKSLGAGTVSSTTDPNVNNLNFQYANPTNNLYPTIRMDYNTTQKVRMNFAINRTMSVSPSTSAPYFPSSDFTTAGVKSDNATVSYGLDWTFSPRMVNQFRAGWLYNFTANPYNPNSKAYFSNPYVWAWPSPWGGINGLSGSGQSYYRPITNAYPNWTGSDTLNWQKASHNFAFGFSFIRENDRYWNGPEGIATIGFGLVNGDPAVAAFTSATLPFSSTAQQGEAQSLYALLTGRISGVSGLYPYQPSTGGYLHGVGSYNLDELAKAWGLFAQDSWKIRHDLTLNYGLRWDFTGDDHDLTSEYHNSNASSVYGPTAPQNLFQPGQLGGNPNPTIDVRAHAYNSWNVSPQPAFGFAYNPHREGGGLLGNLLSSSTVIRGGYSLRRFTVPYQYIWDVASDYGSFYYQNFALTATNTPGAGNFAPGSLSLGQTLPAYSLAPTVFQTSVPQSQFTFIGSAPGVNGFPSSIGQPYVQSWNFGIQRGLGQNRVLEIRYNGNRTLKQWIALNTNEVNVFENGFLKEFENAQNNYKINCNPDPTFKCAPGGVASFANLNPAAGTVPLPIMNAAFTGSNTPNITSSQWKNATFITALQTGAVGSIATRLATVGAAPYFCNMVGVAFTPCATNAGYTGAGAGYPINFWQANPYAESGTTAASTGLMSDAGYSSYNGLQVDFRQQSWHGMQFDANYTWSKTLGILPGGTGNDWTGAYTGFTLRDLRASYLPAGFDAHHVVHVNSSADLPFGRGKAFVHDNGFLDRIVGGWNVGTIVTWQSGYPSRLTGGYNTYGNGADDGIVLNGVTQQQLQNSVGVYRIPGATFVSLINPQYLNVSSQSCLTQWVKGCAFNGMNPQDVTANTTPGTFNSPVFLYGPHGFYQDLMVTKNLPIMERVRFNVQAAFLNAWNHPVFGNGTSPAVGGNVRSSSFTTSGSGTPRNIELRANIEF
ncbi:MAG TPA: carboxypeptidase regulatory-like domain-containing protein [Terriglobales bacterium]|nr:carboxypeptidase regulatory-like domain-containing protein [Terriglobales bacterium]